MRVKTEIKKWANGLALRVTGITAKMPNFKAGTRMSVDVSSECLIVKPADNLVRTFRFPYSESDLLAGMTPAKAHAGELANPTRTEQSI